MKLPKIPTPKELEAIHQELSLELVNKTINLIITEMENLDNWVLLDEDVKAGAPYRYTKLLKCFEHKTPESDVMIKVTSLFDDKGWHLYRSSELIGKYLYSGWAIRAKRVVHKAEAETNDQELKQEKKT